MKTKKQKCIKIHLNGMLYMYGKFYYARETSMTLEEFDKKMDKIAKELKEFV
jgi:hypothetical protein